VTRPPPTQRHADHTDRTEDQTHDDGSVTPLVLGMALILVLLTMGIAAASDVWLTRNRLQNRCEGAALAASYAAGVPGARQLRDANNAAIDYLSLRTTTTGVAVSVGDDTLQATCWSTEEITFGWLVGSADLTQTVTSNAQLRYH
jgi:Putative Flp pilus-assembly TadE/G-like